MSRLLPAAVAAVLTAVLPTAGCGSPAVPAPDPAAEVVVSRTGGVAGMTSTEPCGDERRRSTPAFDRVLALVADAAQGHFDEPLRADDVPALTLRTDRSGSRGPYAVEATPDGRLTLTRPASAPERRVLDADARDALALVAAGLLDQPATPCSSGSKASSWTVTVGSPDGRRATGSACAFGTRGTDALAVHLALSAPFDLD